MGFFLFVLRWGHRHIFLINDVFTVSYIVNPRSGTWAELSSCQVRRFRHMDAPAPSGSALADVAVPKTRAVFRHRLIAYQKVKV